MTRFSSLWKELLSIELGNGDTQVLFTATRRKAAVNRGLQEFADLTECYQRTWYTPPVPSSGGGGNVTLYNGEWSLSTLITSTDYLRPSKEPVRFHHVDAAGNETILEGHTLPRRDVPWLSVNMPGWALSTIATGTQQLPALYYLRYDAGHAILGFLPRPSTAAGEDVSFDVPYVARPALLTSDSHEPFWTADLGWSTVVDQTPRFDLRPYHQALVHYAASKLELLRRDLGASQTQMQAFLSYVARYLGASRQKGGTIVGYVKNYFNVRGTDVGVDPRR